MQLMQQGLKAKLHIALQSRLAGAPSPGFYTVKLKDIINVPRLPTPATFLLKLLPELLTPMFAYHSCIVK